MTWGDSHYMGLTGLEVVGQDGEGLPLDLSMMAASPRDLNDLPDYENDLRTLDKYGRHDMQRMLNDIGHFIHIRSSRSCSKIHVFNELSF